jgi:hypothetical protein
MQSASTYDMFPLGGILWVKGLVIQRPLGLPVDHEPADLLLRDPQRDQDSDGVALLRGRHEHFSPAATGHPRH